MGARAPRALEKETIQGRFILKFTVTDNATTVSDLTASVADPRILDMIGATAATNDPSVIVVAESISVALVEGPETPEILCSVVQTLQLTHTPQQGDDIMRVGLHDFLTSMFEGSDIAAGPLYANNLQRVETFPLDDPMWIDFTVDTLTINPVVAVNSAGNITGYLFIDGYAFLRDNGYSRQQLKKCRPVMTPELRITERRRTKIINRKAS